MSQASFQQTLKTQQPFSISEPELQVASRPRRTRRVQFEDLKYMDSDEQEKELQREEARAIKNLSRKKQEEILKKFKPT
jgi:hypothetical protein